MPLVGLAPCEEIPMDEVLVWKFPLPSDQPKPSLTMQVRHALADWLMEAARRVQPKDEKTDGAS
jgi:hypothetical protein